MRNSSHAAWYHESTAKVTVWRTAALAVFLSLAAPLAALAAETKPVESSVPCCGKTMTNSEGDAPVVDKLQEILGNSPG